MYVAYVDVLEHLEASLRHACHHRRTQTGNKGHISLGHFHVSATGGRESVGEFGGGTPFTV